jgi:ABC-type multidrug transport system permease subunit
MSGTSPDYTEYFSMAGKGGNFGLFIILFIFILIFAFIGYQIYNLKKSNKKSI